MARAAESLDFHHFLEGLKQQDGLHLSPERFARELALEQQQLAVLAGVHRNTVKRMPNSPQLQKYLREAVRVLAAATDFTGDCRRAAFWFRNQPLAIFDYKTPETLVSEGRTEEVLRYINTLEAGTG